MRLLRRCTTSVVSTRRPRRPRKAVGACALLQTRVRHCSTESTSTSTKPQSHHTPEGALWTATGHRGDHQPRTAAATAAASPYRQRYKMDIEYFGTRYSGFARQPNLHTVQGCLEDALSCLAQGIRPAGAKPFHVFCSGRTDAGVHALHQVAHVDITRLDKRTLEPVEPFPADAVRNAVNQRLHRKREDIRVRAVQKVSPSFHARFSACERSYVYRLLFDCDRVPQTLGEQYRCWHLRGGALDVPAMRATAQHLVGRHDFTSFRSLKCENPNPVRDMRSIDITENEPSILGGLTHDSTTQGGTGTGTGTGNMMHVRLRADGFLYNQVRIIMRALVLVGQGHLSADDVARILAERKRPAILNDPAPPYGLYLTDIRYPPEALAFSDSPNVAEPAESSAGSSSSSSSQLTSAAQ